MFKGVMLVSLMLLSFIATEAQTRQSKKSVRKPVVVEDPTEWKVKLLDRGAALITASSVNIFELKFPYQGAQRAAISILVQKEPQTYSFDSILSLNCQFLLQERLEGSTEFHQIPIAMANYQNSGELFKRNVAVKFPDDMSRDSLIIPGVPIKDALLDSDGVAIQVLLYQNGYQNIIFRSAGFRDAYYKALNLLAHQ
jgi:hypothetical protein